MVANEVRHATGIAACVALIAFASTTLAQEHQPPRDAGKDRPGEGRPAAVQPLQPGQPPQPGRPAPAPPPPNPGPSPAPRIAGHGPAPSEVYRLRAVVFELALPLDQVASFEARELLKEATTPAACEKLLANIGATRALYSFDQTLSTLRPRIEVGTNRPFVTGRVSGNDGKTASVVDRQQSEANVELVCMPVGEGDKAPRVVALIEFTTLGESDVTLGDGLKAPITRTVAQTWAGEADGAPALLVAISGDEGRANATAFVTWLSVARVP